MPRPRRSFPEHILSRLTVTPGCWNWTGAVNNKGYGVTGYLAHRWLVHRLVYELFVTPFDHHLFVCHSCDNRICARPSHLFLGTPKDNTHDMLRKNREAYGERSGSATLTEAEVVAIRSLYANGNILQQELAEIFHVRSSQISRIVTGVRWAKMGLKMNITEGVKV